MIQLEKAKTIFEPFRVKSVEKLPILTTPERQFALEKSYFNLFSLPATTVTFDLLTDSGTSAMSANQWAGIMNGDESYAGSPSYTRFENAVRHITQMEHIIPTHQGRSAEALLMSAMLKKGKVVIGNTHFDTTRANIENNGAEALDMPTPETEDSSLFYPFKGNINIASLESYLQKNHEKVDLLIMTVTNNSVGGQPVSMENIKQAKQAVEKYGIPMYLDAARFAENSYFIKKREPGFEDRTVLSIAQEMFSYADGALMSAKKDAFGNIGGFLSLRNETITKNVRTAMVITEGFPTYGGLTGRDMEALAIGLEEVVDEAYLEYRTKSVEYFGRGIAEAGFPIVTPVGGHAVYIDAEKSLPHIPVEQFPGQALSIALYEYIGIRSVEVGSVMLGHRDQVTGKEYAAPHELVRLAMPRRVYTQSHVDYMVEMMAKLKPYTDQIKGCKFIEQAPVLRHFTAKFARA